MKKNFNSIIWGLVIIVIGILFLGNNLSWWNIDIFFDGWWTLFIIIPSLLGLIKKETLYSSLLGLSIGILLFLASQDIINWSMVGKIFIPIVLIVVGLSIIFKPKYSKIKTTNDKKKEYLAVFSSTEEKIDDIYDDISCISVFGEVELDFRKAKIKKDIKINCVSVFGGVNLFVPDNVKVKTSGVPIFGGIDNKVENTDEKYTIYINYVSIFGGVDIK